MHLYVKCLVGQEILDRSERLLLLVILVVGGALCLAGAVKQAEAAARVLQPLALRALDAVVKYCQR